MKKYAGLKKIFAVLLALVMLLPCVSAAAFAEERNPDGRTLPTIHVRGKTAPLYKDYGTENQVQIFDNWTGRVPVPDGYIEEQVKALLPSFAKAVLTNDYDAWAADFSGVLEPIYHDLLLDKAGNPQYNTGTNWNFDYSYLQNRVNGDGTYSTDAYEFEYDWRLSPLDVVDDLHDYIEAVLAVTGKSEYNLVARCEGACVAAAYLAKYPDSRIRSIAYMAPCSNGCAQISCLFAGDVKISTAAVNRYMSLNFGTDAEDGFGADLIGDPTVLEFLRQLIAALSLTHGLDLPASQIERIFNTVKDKVYPGLLMTSFGSFPGYWAMVDDAHYETAKKLCGIADDPEYAAFVQKLDDYHYNVQNKQVEVLNRMKAGGASFSLLVKYGTEILPIIADADLISDSTVTVKEASYGAVTAPHGQILPEDYVSAAVNAGNGRYLSPDGQIDASACAFPDDTYFLKYCPHGEWYGEVYWWLNRCLEKGTAENADNNERYPRFLFWDREQMNISPLSEENMGRYEDYYESNPGSAVTRLISSFRSIITRLIDMIRGLIDGIRARAKGEPVTP